MLRGLFEASLKPPGQLSRKERMDLAQKGHALPDGSWPIRNLSDLTKHAMPSFGRGVAAGNGARVKAHLLRRARSLGASPKVINQIKGYST